MFVFENQLRVRYAETDQMGYMYYGNYAAFYEVARTEMLRSTGISYKELEDMGVMLPVLELKCRYLKPARYDELITIRTKIRVKPSIRLKFEHEFFNEAGELIHTGSAELVFVDIVKNKPCLPPAIFQEKMVAYFGE